jgi:aspartate/methionine/tyrosine aminotransferase
MVKKVLIDKADRLYQIPPDIFSFIKSEDKKNLLKKADLIDLGRFNWFASGFEKYQTDAGDLQKVSKGKLDELKKSLSEWFYKYHKVKLNPQKEIYIGSGISKILFQTAMAFVDNNDLVFVPDIALPLYRKVVTSFGGEAVGYGFSYKKSWKSSFDRINSQMGRVARMLFINSPHNPTGSLLSSKELENLIWIAARENIVVVNDAAYQSLYDPLPPSLLTIKNSKKVALELYSFAYSFGLPSIPFGFAVGNRELISGLEQSGNMMKDYIPQCYFDWAMSAIRQFPSGELLGIKKQLIETKSEANKFLELLEIESVGEGNIPFLWGRINRRKSSTLLASQLFRRYRILSAPGIAFGDNGEGYVRFSLTASVADYKKASDRIKKRRMLMKREK